MTVIRDYYPGGMPQPGRVFYANSPHRYGYQGSEKDDEIAKGLYTTHFRQLDTRLLRWWSVDPQVSKLPWQSPYNSMDLNPVLFNDPLGDEVKVEGKKRDQRKFVRQLNRTTGNKYGIDDEGMLFNKGGYSNVETNSKKSGELSAIVGNAIADEEVFTLPLTRHDDNTLFDSYDRATVDVGDFARSSRIMQAGLFAHFLTERMENPGDYSPENRTETNFDQAHDEAKVAESIVVNAMLGQAYVKVIQSETVLPRLDQSGNVMYYFMRGRSIYGGKVFGLDYGVRLIPKGNGEYKAIGTGKMYNKFKKR